MKREDERLRKIFERTDGRCHLCRAKLGYGKYGAVGRSGSWEIEHSVPRSKGGTDHLNNLYASCISCNRAKGNSSTTTARAQHGHKRAPLSRDRKINNAWTWGAVGSMAALFVPPHLRLVTLVTGAVTGAVLGLDSEPD